MENVIRFTRLRLVSQAPEKGPGELVDIRRTLSARAASEGRFMPPAHWEDYRSLRCYLDYQEGKD